MSNTILVAIAIILLATSCRKEKCDKIEGFHKGLVVRDYSAGDCPYYSLLPAKEYDIRTDSAYNSFLSSIDTSLNNCFERVRTYEKIDFSKFSLLGALVEGGGCDARIGTEVQRNNTTKQYIYTVELIECGNCYQGFQHWAWVVVPKIPDDYSVVFVKR